MNDGNEKLGDDTVRGGQTVFHGIRMWSQLVRVGILVVAGLTLAVPTVQLWRDHSGYDTYAAAMLTLAETKLAMGYGDHAGQEVRLENSDTVVARIADIAAYEPWREVRRQMSETLSAGMWLGAKIGAGIVLAMLVWSAGVAAGSSAASAYAARNSSPRGCFGSASIPFPAVSSGGSPAGRHLIASRACPTPTAPRPSTPSSQAPRDRARRC